VYWIYSFLLFVGFLIYAPAYFFRLRIGRRERLYLADRLGLRLPPPNPGRPLLWIHAVSVGEVLSLKKLVPEIKSRHPSWLIYFSVLTDTGYRVAKKALPQADAVFFVPFDFYLIVKRFFKILKPELFLLAESEFWPNLLRAAGKNVSAVLLINGRISDRSYRRYRRLKPLAKRLLRSISLYLVQSEIDEQRLKEIGVPPDLIKVAGNLKADVLLPEFKPEDEKARREMLGLPEWKRLIVAGSTHRGEEALILKAYQMARKKREDLLLVIAPRHPQRACEIEEMAAKEGLMVRRRTSLKTGDQPDVLIIDTIGELASLYALADIAFIGGSLVPHGGQNLLEPAFYGKPVFFGPHMDNFAFLAREFVRAGAARIVRSEKDLAEVFRLEDEAALRDMGRRAGDVLQSLRGATERTLSEIERLMDRARKEKL